MAVVSYKCPNCDGGLVFEPAGQQFGCEYCGSRFTEAQLADMEPARQSETKEEAKTSREWEQSAPDKPAAQAVLYHCPSCGAEVVTDDTTAATFCYYCHNPVVLAGRLGGDYTPDKVIPFRVTKEEAVAAFLGWAGKKWFTPKAFVAEKNVEKITGVYFPYWMADFDLHGRMDAAAATVRVWRTGSVEYTETRHFRVEREGTFRFGGMSAGALKKAEKKLVEGVLPFDNQSMKDFNMGFLSGFQAEKRDIERAEVAPWMEGLAKEYTEKMLRESAQGYSQVFPKVLAANITSGDWQYTLLPVWVLTYRGMGGKIFYYAMNGQTGKVCGVLPVSKGKLAALFAAISVPLFALLCVGGWLL